MKKILFAIFILGTICYGCNNQKSNPDKEQTDSHPALLLKQVVISYLNREQQADTIHFSYDEQNRIIDITTISEQSYSSVDSIRYDQEGRIVTMRIMHDSGSPSGARQTITNITYEEGKAIVHENLTYIDAAPDLVLDPVNTISTFTMKGDRILSVKSNDGDEITVYNYDEAGNCLTDHEVADSIYANPYSLVGNQFFWKLVDFTPQKGNPSWYRYQSTEVYEIQPYKTAVDAAGRKYIQYMIIADGGDTTAKEEYTYNQ